MVIVKLLFTLALMTFGFIVGYLIALKLIAFGIIKKINTLDRIEKDKIIELLRHHEVPEIKERFIKDLIAWANEEENQKSNGPGVHEPKGFD